MLLGLNYSCLSPHLPFLFSLLTLFHPLPLLPSFLLSKLLSLPPSLPPLPFPFLNPTIIIAHLAFYTNKTEQSLCEQDPGTEVSLYDLDHFLQPIFKDGLIKVDLNLLPPVSL